MLGSPNNKKDKNPPLPPFIKGGWRGDFMLRSVPLGLAVF